MLSGSLFTIFAACTKDMAAVLSTTLLVQHQWCCNRFTNLVSQFLPLAPEIWRAAAEHLSWNLALVLVLVSGGPPAPIMLSGSPCHRSASHPLATFSPISPLTPFCQQSSASNTVMALLGGAKTPNLDFGRPCSANLLFSRCDAFYAN